MRCILQEPSILTVVAILCGLLVAVLIAPTHAETQMGGGDSRDRDNTFSISTSGMVTRTAGDSIRMANATASPPTAYSTAVS